MLSDELRGKMLVHERTLQKPLPKTQAQPMTKLRQSTRTDRRPPSRAG